MAMFGAGLEKAGYGDTSGANKVYKQGGGIGNYQDWGNTINGTSKDAGILGLGQYKANPVDIDKEAFYNNPASQQLQGQLAQQAKDVQGRQGAQANTSQDSQFRGQQMSLADALTAQANGQGPSLAQSQLQQATEGNIQSAMAMGASQRGGSPAMAQRNIQMNAANANQQAAMQSAQTRMAEQMAARQQLGGVLSGARGQDIGLEQGNQSAEMQQRGLNDTQNRFDVGTQAQLQAQDQQAKMAYNNLNVNQNAQLAGANATAYQNASANRANFLGNMGSAFGFLNKGGMVPGYAEGGPVDYSKYGQVSSVAPVSGAQTSMASKKSGKKSSGGSSDSGGMSGDVTAGEQEEAGNGYQTGASGYAAGSAPASEMAMNYDAGGMVGKLAPLLMMLADKGGNVPGKAPVSGDSPKNDIVPAMVSPGEIVLPRSVAQAAIEDPNSPKLKTFLAHIAQHYGNHGPVDKNAVASAMKRKAG